MVLSVVIADDHPIVLNGLASLIGADDGFRVVGSASNGPQALQLIREQIPDIAVLDLSMPGCSGLDVLCAVDDGATRVVLLAATISDGDIYDAVTQDVAGLVLKETAPGTLMECLYRVAAGGRWLPPEVVDRAMASETRRRDTWNRVSSTLTSRERQIVALLVAGASNKDAAFELQVSEGTLKVHLNNIFRKLQVASRSELQRLAEGLVNKS